MLSPSSRDVNSESVLVLTVICVQTLSYREAEKEDKLIPAQQAARPLAPPVQQDDDVDFAGPPCLLMLCLFAACSVCLLLAEAAVGCRISPLCAYAGA